MTDRRPLVNVAGTVRELASPDLIDSSVLPSVAASFAYNMLAGESFTVTANKQMPFGAGIVSAEPTGTIAVIDGIGVS